MNLFPCPFILFLQELCFGLILILAICALWMTKKIEKKLKAGEKGRIFIEHIQKHLSEREQVICKICHKTVDEIYEEAKMIKEGSKVNGKGGNNHQKKSVDRACDSIALLGLRFPRKRLLSHDSNVRRFLSDMREIFIALSSPFFVVAFWIYLCYSMAIPNPFRALLIWGVLGILALLVAYYNPKARCR